MAAADRGTEYLDSVVPNPYTAAILAIAAVAPERYTEVLADMAIDAPNRRKCIAAIASATGPVQAAYPGTECLASNAAVAPNRDKESRRKFVAAVAAAVAANAAFVDMIEGYYVGLMKKLCETLVKAEDANRRAKEKDDIVERLKKDKEELVEKILTVEDEVTETDKVVERLQKENNELIQKMNMLNYELIELN